MRTSNSCSHPNMCHKVWHRFYFHCFHVWRNAFERVCTVTCQTRLHASSDLAIPYGHLHLTVCFQLVCCFVDFALQSGVFCKLVHHTDGGLLLLHFVDFSPHLTLLLSVFLDHSGELGGVKNKQRCYQKYKQYIPNGEMKC